MKKALLFAASLLAVSFANAQEGPRPDGPHHHGPMGEGPAPMEMGAGLKPETHKLTTEVAFVPFTTDEVSLENARLNFAYSLTEKWSIRAGLGWGVSNEKDKNDNETVKHTEFSFAPGVVYSFAGTPKFNPYVGAEVVVSSKKNEAAEKEVDHTVGFGANVFTGMNYYFSKNLYVGVEFGIGFKHEKEKDSEVKENNFAPYAQPAVRLGWAF